MNVRVTDDDDIIFYDHHGTDHVKVSIKESTGEHQTDDAPECLRTLSCYSINITNLSGQAVNDPIIQRSIRKMVNNFFEERAGQNVLLHFEPVSSDGKQPPRLRLFRRYFAVPGKSQHYKYITRTPIPSMSEFTMGFILKKDNPHFHELYDSLENGAPHILLKLAV